MSNEIIIPISDITYVDKNKNIKVYNSEKHYGYYDNRSDNKLTKQILESKRPPLGEIELTFFEWCPINCAFCNHDKKSTIGMSKELMFSKLSIIDNFVKDSGKTVDVIQINFVGGELLADQLLDEYIPIYKEFINEVSKISKKYDIKIEGVWVSNFLFKNNDKILDFFKYLSTTDITNSLICSYDFSGRPTNSQYYQNIKYLKEYISSINIVATSDTILNMMKNNDEFFSEYLYNTFEIYIDDFIPDENTDSMIPSDSLMLDFLKFLYHNYPEVNPIKELVVNDVNSMSCLSLNKITIFPDNSISNCKWHRYKPSDFNTYKESKINYVDNAPQMKSFIDENECLSCEFFNKCGFRCYTQYDWGNRERDLTECLMKLFFRYIQ